MVYHDDVRFLLIYGTHIQQANFIKTKRFAMIKALKDTMIFPNEGEWWGHFADGSQKEVLPMKQTKWYTEDLFGLKTVDEAGKIVFNTTEGNHLQFTHEQLVWWVDNYFVKEPEPPAPARCATMSGTNRKTCCGGCALNCPGHCGDGDCSCDKGSFFMPRDPGCSDRKNSKDQQTCCAACASNCPGHCGPGDCSCAKGDFFAA